ncbi:DUF1128 domain-containing protein [Oceanobacillus chungangensis]|uniref:DUF1128 domain-containing protein n=1 Tax=Oceanobacillus chungangensis TaxID=1229152 RepID=A0A3D8PSA4_9BACI|nr:DUF1128 family protein [Oceanobacillus chungangensis]RDW17865.1 DUF1128 domain-containing protein [Oceanobacillus chungangensis]
MDLSIASEENLKHLLNDLAVRLQVVNVSLLDAEDYDLEKYDDIKFLYDIVVKKGKLSTLETQAFLEELAGVRIK